MTIEYKEYGDKRAPLIVFIHGGGVGGWMWKKQIHYFAHYHCLVPEVKVHGDFSIKQTAQEMNEIIGKVSENKVVIVVGFSLGAQILVEMLGLNPNLIDYAVINSALVRPTPFAGLLPVLMKMTLPLAKNKAFAKLQAKSMYIDKDNFDTYYIGSLQIEEAGFVRMMKENSSFQIPSEFAHARGKILVTVGAKEQNIAKKSLEDIVKMNERCKGIIIPNIGHGISLANPMFFNQMIEEWITYERIPNGVVEVAL